MNILTSYLNLSVWYPGLASMVSSSPPNPSPNDPRVANQPAAGLRVAIDETIKIFCANFGLSREAVRGDHQVGQENPDQVWHIRWIDQRLYGPIQLTETDGRYRSKEQVTADTRTLLETLANDPDRALDLSIAQIGVQLPAVPSIPGFSAEESRLIELVLDPERNQKLQAALKSLKELLEGVKGTMALHLSSESPHFVASIEGKAITVFFRGVFDRSETSILDEQHKRILEQRNLIGKGQAELTAELALDFHTANIRALWW